MANRYAPPAHSVRGRLPYARLFNRSFFLGLIEAIVTPGMTILTSIWYSQREVPFRSLIWYSFNGWAGIFGGFLAYGVGSFPRS